MDTFSIVFAVMLALLGVPLGMLGTYLLPRWLNWYGTTSKRRAKSRLYKADIHYRTRRETLRDPVLYLAFVSYWLARMMGHLTMIVFTIGALLIGGPFEIISRNNIFKYLTFSVLYAFVFAIVLNFLKVTQLRRDAVEQSQLRNRMLQLRNKLRKVIGKPEIQLNQSFDANQINFRRGLL